MPKAEATPITRRRALAATFALSTAAGAGGVIALDAALSGAEATEAAPHPDAAILAYAPRLAALKAEIDSRRAALRQVSAVHDAMNAPRPEQAAPGFDAWLQRWRRTKEESGYDAAEAALDNAVFALDRVLDEIILIPARTLDGLCLKARYSHGYDATIESIVADLVAIDRARAAA